MPGSSDKNTRPQGTNPFSIRKFYTPRGMRILAMMSLVLIGLAGVGMWLLYPSLFPKSMPTLEPPGSLEDLAIVYPELAAILLDPNLDSAYKDVFLVYTEQGSEAALELARRSGMVDSNDQLRLTLELDTTETATLVQQLEAAGMKVTAVSGSLVDVAIPIELLKQTMESGDFTALFSKITDLEHIIHIRLPRDGIRQVSNTGSESLAVIFADEWQARGFTGDGIKIGVLDLGFDGYRKLLGTELPANVVARSFISETPIDKTGEVHGTAVAEVVFDVAPGAELYFAAYSTDVEQRLAVDWLVAQGVDIISHSVRSIYGPMDGTGGEARMVDRVVEGGVLWVNCAGNDAETHYWGRFTDEDGDQYHDFSPGDPMMKFTPLGRVRMALNWDDWENGDQDYDLIVMDEEMNKIVSSENIQNGPGDDAAEFIEYEFFDDGPYYVAFYARKTTHPGILNFFMYEGENLEYTTAEYSITSPADSASAFTIGATFWSNDSLESYSSRGPTLDGRLKPDLSAPTGVGSATYGEPFYGTSASAPHVAAAAALVWQANPDYTAQQVREFLSGRAIDLGPTGADNLFGIGRLWLGDVPGISRVLTPTSAATETRVPTATVLPTQTIADTEILTPTIVYTPTPSLASRPSSAFSNNLILTLGFIGCVAFPGLAGLGGVSLLGFLWYRRGTSSPSISSDMDFDPKQTMDFNLPPSARESFTVEGRSCPRCGTQNRPEARYCRYCGLQFSHYDE